MENINMKFIIVVVCLAVCIGASWGGSHDGAKANEEKARKASTKTVNDVKDSAVSSDKSDKDAGAPAFDAAAPAPATEESESFGQWAYEKFIGGN
ncbi:hypothetical protein PHAVU_005G135988 [Phaseolus vulgaris]|uniref:Uncharacterized protein n=1 Tax=Phaseolus vulgaris TaxID=3885 RepID=V7AI11_PHAVU|nr:hypothetical protein PHAVU_011G135000g [Phaseolus vulgaris]ESW04900.1 hypothetical protein PHAVU_011G135000g [Phaseolus vulgaris]